jgi:hypothetical protein
MEEQRKLVTNSRSHALSLAHQAGHGWFVVVFDHFGQNSVA